MGNIFNQLFGDAEKHCFIVFVGRQLTRAERNYTTTKHEALAMVFSVKTYRHYLLLSKVLFLLIIGLYII